MHLIGALAAGIIGAENGYAKILTRGTTRRARYYSDFEGSSAVDSSNVSLDENGGAVVYVNVAVDVIVYDSSNQEVRRFVESASAGCVEVISQSFTGADYETQSGGANKPTTLSAALDRLLTSFGAEDFKVLMPDGTKKTLRQALSAVSGVYYNVKSPLYGASGDGVANDAAAVQAAITAASAAGGGTVFFPAGTYYLGTTQITVPDGVSLLGAGSSASIIRTAKTDGHAVIVETSATGIRTIVGLKFNSSTTSCRQLVNIDSGARVAFRSCYFVVTSTSYYGVSLDGVGTGTYVSFEDCDFSVEGGDGAIDSNVAPRFGRVDVRRCKFSIASTFTGTFVTKGSSMHLYACTFDNSDATAGAYSCIGAYDVNGTYGSVRCCEFLDSGGATVTCMALSTISASTECFTEDGNIIPGDATNLTWYSYVGGSTPGYYCNLGTRESRYKSMSLSTTTVALTEVGQYGVISVRSTGAGNFTMTADDVGTLGQRLRVVFVNGDASTRTLTFGTNMKGGSFTIASNEAIGLEFVMATANNGVSDVNKWFLVSTSGALTTGTDSSYSV